MHTFTATEPTRLDSFLAQKLPQFSRAQLQHLISQSVIEVNGTLAAKASHKLKIGDTVLVQREPQDLHLEPTSFTLPILLEDESILVVNKPVGLVVHPTTPDHTDSVAHQIISYLPSITSVVQDPESVVSTTRPGIVHRLDKDTTGVLVIAKTKEALANLSEQFHNHTTIKTYTVLCYGTITQPQTISANLVRRGNDKTNKMKATLKDEGKSAITHITPVSQHARHNTSYTVVSCQIETGRTHQIRAHLLSIGHSVLGDSIYYTKPSYQLSKKLKITRQMLHATTLSFTHPKTGAPVTVTAPYPSDMLQFL